MILAGFVAALVGCSTFPAVERVQVRRVVVLCAMAVCDVLVVARENRARGDVLEESSAAADGGAAVPGELAP